MKATDLMIGDWVTFKNAPEVPAKIWGIAGDDTASAFIFTDNENALEEISLDKIIGIPLAPEILEKNGFASYNNSSFQLRENGMYISWRNVGRLNIFFGCSPITSVHIKCKYVHQLQRALKLCGIDKTIEL